jgi:beta-phosphoglucomutase
MIQAVLFDFDGVLVDSMPAHVKAWQQILAEIGITPPDLYIELHEGEKAEVTVSRLLTEHGQDASPQRVLELITRKRSLYHQSAPTGLVPAARSLVDELRRRTIQSHIVTGSILRNLERTISVGELALFTTITAADDYEFGKPHPAPYLTGLARTGCVAADCLVLENAPLGIRSARAAGLKTLAIATTLPASYLGAADHIITSYEELLDYA